MQVFNKISLSSFNYNFDTDIDANDTFETARNKIETAGYSIFYASLNANDLSEPIQDEADFMDQLSVEMYFIDEIGIYIALY